MRLDIQADGVRKSDKRTLNFIAGNDIVITITDDIAGNQADIQIDSTAAGGPGGSAHTIAEAGAPVTDRGTLSFGAGFDIVDDGPGDTTEVNMDLTEQTVVTDIAYAGNVV